MTERVISLLRRVRHNGRRGEIMNRAMYDTRRRGSKELTSADYKRELDGTVILYHATTGHAAAQILKSGFRDSTGTYMMDRECTGVFVSDRPLDQNEGAKGDSVLQITLHASADLCWNTDAGR
jgi:hypothetical protein